MFILADDKSARGQLTGVIAELQRNVASISSQRRLMETEGRTRTDAYKILTAKKHALNETIAFIQEIDVMTDDFANGGELYVGELITQTETVHIPTYTLNGMRRVVVDCSCGQRIADAATYIGADHAVGNHIRKATDGAQSPNEARTNR